MVEFRSGAGTRKERLGIGGRGVREEMGEFRSGAGTRKERDWGLVAEAREKMWGKNF